MSILEKIFNRKKQVPEPTVPAIVDPIGDPPKDPNLIQIFDKYGRKLFIAKDDWRTQVLPGTIQSNWTKPDELYRIILDALRDGFRSDVVHAAQQLYKIDTNPVRAACIWAIVLMEVNRLDDAEQVLRDCIAQHGDDGAILTNLAKVYANRNDDDQSEKILWHALEVDPNQENAFAWYAAMYSDRGGEAASLTAMRRVASLPGSWRAQLWLAREALTTKDFAAALSLYRESLARVAKPVPSDVLMQMSGDLGNSGHLREILQLVEPHFDVAFHGLDVGNNLIKAHVDLRQFEQASQILNQLSALNRPDYKEYLGYWDTWIRKSRRQGSPRSMKKTSSNWRCSQLVAPFGSNPIRRHAICFLRHL